MPLIRHLSPVIFLILSNLVSIVYNATTCTNLINGSTDEQECPFECCLDGGSYAIVLQKSEVCSDANLECTSAAQNIPTSCPIKVNDKLEMFGCGVGEACCSLVDKDDMIPEFNYLVTDRDLVCSSAAGSCDYNPPDDTVSENVFCYENCLTVMHFTTNGNNIGVPETDLYSPCEGDNVRVCSAAADEACLYFDTRAKAYEVNQKEEGNPEKESTDMEITIRMSYCGAVADASVNKAALLCDRVKNQLIHSNADNITFYAEEMQCGKLMTCTEDCIDNKHVPEEDNTLEWWVILIICLLVLAVVIALVILLFYIKFYKKRSVSPKGVVTPVVIVEPVDPRLMRMRELERYLIDSIKLKDMADLKLTIDIVEGEGFQDDLKEKYDEAIRLYNELMSREKEAKLKELEEAESKAEEAKRALEEAEKEVLRRQKEEDEEALRQAIKARDVAKAKWMRLWPRLQILRALNSLNAELVAKAMEESRKAREEEEKQRKLAEEEEKRRKHAEEKQRKIAEEEEKQRKLVEEKQRKLAEEEEKQRKLAEEQANKINYCKQILQNGIATLNEEDLENAIKTTDLTVFQTTTMQTDGELKDLYSQAKLELEQLREEKARKEKEAEEKRKEEERIRQEKRTAALDKLEDLITALRTGISERDIEKLEAAISNVEENHLEEDMVTLYKQAKELHARLQKIEKVKKNIQELKRPLIAELKSMASPPIPVHRAMTATYLLLGEEAKYLREWSNIVILLNKTGAASIKRRVQELKFSDVPEEGAKAGEEQILGLTAMEVYEANQAASLFFDWAEMICYERKQAV